MVVGTQQSTKQRGGGGSSGDGGWRRLGDGGGGFEFKLSRFKMRLGADYLRREVDIGGGKTENVGDIRATVGFVF